MIDFTRKFRKMIGQYRFRPTLISLARITDFASEYEKEFTEWRSEKPAEITLFSPEKKKFLTLSDDSITYANEDNGSEVETILDDLMQIKKTYKGYLEKFGIATVHRIGLRGIEVFQTNLTFQDLADLIHKKYFSGEVNRTLAIETEDIAFIFDGTRDGLHHKVRIGPLRKDESQKKLDNSFEFDFSSLKDGCLYVDIDVFSRSNEFLASEAENQLERLGKEYLSLSEGYFSIIAK